MLVQLAVKKSYQSNLNECDRRSPSLPEKTTLYQKLSTISLQDGHLGKVFWKCFIRRDRLNKYVIYLYHNIPEIDRHKVTGDVVNTFIDQKTNTVK